MEYLDLSIAYGNQTLTRFLPTDRGEVKVISSPGVDSEIKNLESDLITALENPIDTSPLKELVARHYPGSGKKVLLRIKPKPELQPWEA